MTETASVAYDDVHHPLHYNSHPSGVEIKDITGEMVCPHLGNAVKYICRHEHKGNPIQDIEKAAEYVAFERTRRLNPRRAYESPLRYGHPVYRPEYAPFYRYIAAEPDYVIRELLIKIWNADKTDGDDAIKLLNSAHGWLIGKIGDLRRRQEHVARVAESVQREQAESAAAYQRLTEIKRPETDKHGIEHNDLRTEPELEPERVEITGRAAKLLHAVSEGDRILVDSDTDYCSTWADIEVVIRRGSKWVIETSSGELEMHGNRKITVLMDKERIS